MKLANANAIRAHIVETMMAYFVEADEDCGMIASNAFNFPVVAEDGEEGWVEISVKIPKGTKDEEYDGYAHRDAYVLKCEEKAEKAAKREAKKAKAKAEKGK